jgi:hypothetical protein
MRQQIRKKGAGAYRQVNFYIIDNSSKGNQIPFGILSSAGSIRPIISGRNRLHRQ